MEEIKFRTWDKKRKAMDYESADLQLNTFNPTWVLHFKLYEPYGDRFILQQFTGLKDKNGKEIYHGDFIGEVGFVQQVEFKYGAFRVGTNPAIEFIWTRTCRGEDTEVIGNIYENPELLKAS